MKGKRTSVIVNWAMESNKVNQESYVINKDKRGDGR